MFGLLIPIIIVVAIVVATRRHAGVAPDAVPPAAVGALLDRWEGAGLVSAEQRAAIVALEEARRPELRPATPRGPVIAEVLGYLGAVLALVGVGIVVARANFTDAQGALLAGVLGVALAALSLAVPEERGGPWWRFRQVLGLLGLAGLVVAAGLVVGGVQHASPETTVLACGVVGAIGGAALHARRNRPLLLAATFAGLVAAVTAAVAPHNEAGWFTALALAALAAIWGTAAWRGLLPPRWLAVALGTGLAIFAAAPIGASHMIVGWGLATVVAGLALLTGHRRGEPAVLIVSLVLAPIVLSGALAGTDRGWYALLVLVALGAFGVVGLRAAWSDESAEGVAVQVYASAALLVPWGVLWATGEPRAGTGLAALLAGVATATALIVVGASRSRLWVAAVGLLGALVYSAWTAGQFLRGRPLPLLLVVVGLGGLVAAARALRHHEGPTAPQPGSRSPA